MRERITQAIRNALHVFLNKVEHPYDINCGLCEEFAIHVINALQGEETPTLYMAWIEDMVDAYDFLSHAVICWDSGDGIVFFDAECAGGTTELAKLPIIVNEDKTRDEVVNT